MKNKKKVWEINRFWWPKIQEYNNAMRSPSDLFVGFFFSILFLSSLYRLFNSPSRTTAGLKIFDYNDNIICDLRFECFFFLFSILRSVGRFNPIHPPLLGSWTASFLSLLFPSVFKFDYYYRYSRLQFQPNLCTEKSKF